MKKKGILYIVPTPIGNLSDMTFRAVDVLKKAAIIGAEDTRTSKKLLNHYNINTPMISYHKFNERKRVETLIDKLENGEEVAIISDAGTPGISDPSGIIIEEVIKSGFRLEVLPGATAFVPALVASGLNCDRFQFIGFLPEKNKSREALIRSIRDDENTLIFYESPHKLHKFIQFLSDHLGNRRIAIAREISKFYETYYRTTLKEIIEDPDQVTTKGEFVIIVEGSKKLVLSDSEVKKLLMEEISKGVAKKTAIKRVMEKTGLNKNRVYDLILKL